jgi:cardiolipin synthase
MPVRAAENCLSAQYHYAGLALYLAFHIGVGLRVLAVDDKEPASRAAWILVLVFIPAVGVVAYLLFGEPWVARHWRRRARAVRRELAIQADPVDLAPVDAIPDRFRSSFRLCEQLARCPVVGNNAAEVLPDSNAAIEAMVRDFDAARETIHVLFYIWLTDGNGLKVVAALKRAAERGVTCRVIADSMGSRGLIRSPAWEQMRGAGVKLCTSMKILHGLGFAVGRRMDLRNHRKIVVVDDRVTYCGSQNCADPEFRIKPKFAPWVDIMLRFEGPVAQQNQLLFASDWMLETDEDLTALMRLPDESRVRGGFPAIAFGTGPTSPMWAMSSVFVSLLYAAEREVVISSPYFVPDPPLLAAVIACARRGVATTLVLPARNDSRFVGAISKAHYARLVKSGVSIFEFRGGLLHAKTLVVDGVLVLVGSSNMDRRSLDLNFENNILLCSPPVATQVRARQSGWVANADAVDPNAVLRRSLLRRVGDNLATVIGPVM